MLKGEKPSADAAKLLDVDLVLHAEHGSNASSFAARVVIGTQANIHAAVTAAIAALSGPAHGGAAEDVLGMAQEIGEPANVAAYVKKKREAKEAITGFGHRVYRAEDPRARHMREGVKRLSQEMGQPKWYAILEALVQAMAPYARHGVNVNVDFYSGVIYYLHGIPKDLFVPIFAVGRVPGWTVQVLEQLDNNILIRPLTLYSGPDAARLRADRPARLTAHSSAAGQGSRARPGRRTLSVVVVAVDAGVVAVPPVAAAAVQRPAPQPVAAVAIGVGAVGAAARRRSRADGRWVPVLVAWSACRSIAHAAVTPCRQCARWPL